jgi:hypothetical protein
VKFYEKNSISYACDETIGGGSENGVRENGHFRWKEKITSSATAIFSAFDSAFDKKKEKAETMPSKSPPTNVHITKVFRTNGYHL